MNNGAWKYDSDNPMTNGNGKHPSGVAILGDDEGHCLHGANGTSDVRHDSVETIRSGIGKPVARTPARGRTPVDDSHRKDGAWESGADFHWPEVASGSGPAATGAAAAPWDGDFRAYGSGRDALCALVAHGMATRGWRRLWMPTYYCQRVVAAVAATGIELTLYPDAPMDPGQGPEPEACRAGDVLLWVNTLGLRTRPELLAVASTGLERIEDHTHDPWAPLACRSWSDWCIASLRKTVPLPDGGILWSPRRRELPAAAPVTPERRAASLERMAAMSLKQVHRATGAIAVGTYQELAAAGEASLGAGGISGMTAWSEQLLAAWPIAAWREQRWRNFRRLAAALADIPGVQVAAGCYPPNLGAVTNGHRRERCAIPFGVPLLCRSAALAALIRRGLAAASVVADRLWPLDEPVLPAIPWAHRDFSRRMLLLYCDMRFQEEEMERVAGLVRRLCRIYRGAAETGS